VRELSLHLLDIAENSIAAGARNVAICVDEDSAADRLRMSVQDDGKGMDAETVAKVIDPFVTSRTTRKVGLGIPLLKAAAEACNGFLAIQSTLGVGTHVEIEFQRSHIDRMPMGDLAGTFLTLLISYPQMHWKFHYGVDQENFEFDDAPIKEALDSLPLTEPSVLTYLREMIEDGVAAIRPASSW